MKLVAQLNEKSRRELFSETANAMSITAAAAEKDFWICWVLLHVFEDEELSRYLRFKGGTSLSKCYNSIERFSEDIDLILDWTSLTEEDPTAEGRSKTKQRKLNQDINEQAQAHIAEVLLPRLNELMGEGCQLEVDAEDCSGLMEPDTSKRDNMIINRGVYEQEKNVQKLFSGI